MTNIFLPNRTTLRLKPPKYRLPIGIFEFRKKRLVLEDVDYTTQQKDENGQVEHYSIVLTARPGLKVMYDCCLFA